MHPLRFRLLLAIILFIGLFFLLYPLYRYILDDDGIGYAMVTRRWASGDFFNAINGYWSPLHSWLALPFHLAGLELLTAFRASNLLICVLLLCAIDRLSARIELNKKLKLLILLVSVPILLYMCFYQLAADILFCLLFLWYINACAAGDVYARPGKTILCVFIAFLAYLSKAYAFPLFIGHFFCWQYWLSKRSLLPDRKQRFKRNLTIAFSVFLLLSLPWILALQYKYDIWTFGYSGRLNLSWQVMPPNVIPDSFFTAPHLPNSPTLWEDPYFTQGRLYSTFSSGYTFLKQLKIIIHNIFELISALNQLTFLSIGLLMAMLLYLFKTSSGMMLLFLLSITILPAGYLVIHIEERFLWPATFILLIAGVHLLSVLFHTYRFHIIARGLCWMILISGFLLNPLNNLQDMIQKGQDNFKLADIMKSFGAHQTIASNHEYYSQMRKAAFLSNNQYYEINHHSHTYEELQEAVRKSRISYFYFFYSDEMDLKAFQQTIVFNNSSFQKHFPSHKLLVMKM